MVFTPPVIQLNTVSKNLKTNDVLHRYIHRHLPVTAESFSENKSFPRAKPRAVVCRLRTVRSPHAQPALQTGHLQCRLKTPREKLAPLTNCARIRFAQEASVRQHRCGGDGEQRGEALFVLAALVW